MTKDLDSFEIKYWAGGNDFKFIKPPTNRSFRKKLLIVLSFIGVLALFPILLIGVSMIDFSGGDEIVTIHTPISDSEADLRKTLINEPITIEAGVIKNDNYWKISSRICGEGKFYLDIKEQNNSKALFEGDIVTVKCPKS